VTFNTRRILRRVIAVSEKGCLLSENFCRADDRSRGMTRPCNPIYTRSRKRKSTSYCSTAQGTAVTDNRSITSSKFGLDLKSLIDVVPRWAEQLLLTVEKSDNCAKFCRRERRLI
jgi:hypothetical protein